MDGARKAYHSSERCRSAPCADAGMGGFCANKKLGATIKRVIAAVTLFTFALFV